MMVVDHERSHLRHVIFAGHVADAEQQRREERTVMLEEPPTVTTIRK